MPKQKGQEKKSAGKTAATNKRSIAGKRSEQQPKAAGKGASSKPVAAEGQGIIERLINTLKRVIGHKKGERDEVRYNNKEGHKNWVFKQKGENFSAFGVTHNDKTFGNKNMPLKQNPDPKDKDPAYIRNGIIKQKGGMSKKPKKNLKFSSEDKTNMKSKRRYHEKERKRQAAKQKAKNKQKSK